MWRDGQCFSNGRCPNKSSKARTPRLQKSLASPCTLLQVYVQKMRGYGESGCRHHRIKAHLIKDIVVRLVYSSQYCISNKANKLKHNSNEDGAELHAVEKHSYYSWTYGTHLLQYTSGAKYCFVPLASLHVRTPFVPSGCTYATPKSSKHPSRKCLSQIGWMKVQYKMELKIMVCDKMWYTTMLRNMMWGDVA